MMASAEPISLSDLPSQYDHVAAQEKWYPWWEQRGYFRAEVDDPRPPFTIVIPPPNVTGALHLGHALNNTLQDILCRLKRMQGYNVLWMPGTDHAGIATQAVVERRLLEEAGQSRHDLGRDGLVDRIWDWKAQYEQRILSQLRQLGASCDWQRTRFTLDDQCARAVRETFFQLFADHKIYRGQRLVNWDTFLQTAVSDDEVFHDPVPGHFWHIRYPVIDPQAGEPQSVAIATTRPETLLGDTAVAVHPDPAAELDKVVGELEAKLKAAPEKEQEEISAQLAAVAERRRSLLPQLLQLRAMAVRGVQLELPLTGRTIPLIADPWAKPELGSGCVKITPAHDENDYQVWQRNASIGAINIMHPDGTLNENVPEKYRGLTMKQARAAVVEDLAVGGFYDPETDLEDREIDLAHSDRSKTPIEPYLADQWFVRMGEVGEGPDAPGLAQSAMDAVADGRVKIIPHRYAKGYQDWLGEKRDWPIGRQLWWGHRIPVWRQAARSPAMMQDGKDAELAALRQRRIPQLRKLVQEWAAAGRVSVATCDASGSGRSPLLADEDFSAALICVRSADDQEVLAALQRDGVFKQDEDVLDTWFSSALWPHSTLGWPEETAELKKFYPTSTLITSRDIITLWVARMVLTGLYNLGEVPFPEVYIHPKILDGYGETMSKSKGNGVDPLDVIEKFGADALRFGIAYLTTETQDVRMPVEFVCPHCQETIKQTKKNRVLPRVTCDQCGGAFHTQWAREEADLALPRGAVTSERFELGRNFCNKLWNASRFALMNLAGYQAAPVAADQLLLEDRWLLSRLAAVTGEVTQALAEYRYADAARELYRFAWDDFCSFYVEISKARFAVPARRAVAQRVLAHTLDTLLRLLHPMIPFLTEEVWQLLATVAGARGLGHPEPAAESVCIAPWPQVEPSHIDPQIEQQFSKFQAVIGAVRNIRTENKIPPKKEIYFSVGCDKPTADLLQPMKNYFLFIAGAHLQDAGGTVVSSLRTASKVVAGMAVHVSIDDFFDGEAEKKRLESEQAKLAKYDQSLTGKLGNENFVNRAPAEVVQAQRDKLAETREQLAKIETALAEL